MERGSRVSLSFSGWDPHVLGTHDSVFRSDVWVTPGEVTLDRYAAAADER